MSSSSGSMISRGVPPALASAMLLGLTPILGKQAIVAGLPPLEVVALRTGGAAGVLLLVMLLFQRRNLYIFPLGLLGCMIAGALNGIGSLFYYSGLARIDAGLGQLLYMLYPIFVAVLLFLDGQRQTRLTLLRLAICLPAIYLLTQAATHRVDLIGVADMLAAGMLYGLHIPINQRVLYEAPAPTVTMYTLLAMTAVVIPAHFLLTPVVPPFPTEAAAPLIALTAVTFLSRLTLFTGVKRIGGMQTAILGLAQLIVAVALAQLWLKESMSGPQWAGASLLMLALVLVGRDRAQPTAQRGRGWLYWLRPPVATLMASVNGASASKKLIVESDEADKEERLVKG
jgi:drug/metabolite transporter (DMT)-like permease